MVLSESELTALERMVSLTFSLIPREWSFVQKYLSGTARAPENLYGRFDLIWSSEVGGRGPSKRERPYGGAFASGFLWFTSSLAYARFRNRGRITLVFLEMALVCLVYALVIDSILLIRHDSVLLMLPVRVHAGLPSIRG